MRFRTVCVVGVAAAVAAIAAAGAFAISSKDTISTIAGIGTNDGNDNVTRTGFSGDGGPATKAELYFPTGVAVDGKGNVYIADRSNLRVRKVSPNGIITTVAGTGKKYGNLGDGGPATSAAMDPWAVAVDAQGNLYIADIGGFRVREVNPGGTITTFAGAGETRNGTYGFSGDGGPATSALMAPPDGVAVDAKGNVYIADTENQRVRKVNPGGTITTIAGTGVRGFSGDGGPATSAQMNDPEGLAVDPQGNLYIADMGNGRIRKVSPAGTITTLAKGFNQPTGVAVDRQWNVYVAAFASGAVFKVTPRGELTRIVGNGHAYPNLDGGPAGNSWVNSPSGVAVDGNGSLYVADYGQSRIRKVRNVLPIASFTTAPASGQAPLSVVVDASASRDPDGSIVKYALEFGDGTTSRGWKLSHSYTHAGSFTVTLTVTDDSGAVSKTARRTVTVR